MSPPQSLNDLISEKFFQIGYIGFLSEGFLHEFDDITRFDFGQFTDFLLGLRVVDHKHENVLVLVVHVGVKIPERLQEEGLGVFSQGAGDPVIILSSKKLLEKIFAVSAESS